MKRKWKEKNRVDDYYFSVYSKNVYFISYRSLSAISHLIVSVPINVMCLQEVLKIIASVAGPTVH